MTQKVLIVEDEPVLRTTFGEFLTADGYDVRTAEGYDEAQSLLVGEPFDVIVSDIVLRGKTGIDLLRRVDELGLRSPIIMITGDPSVDTAAESVRHRAFDYLQKPVTESELKRVVRIAFEQKRLADERDMFERRMERYRNELEALFESVDEAIVMVDAGLHVRHANDLAQRLFDLDSPAPGSEPGDATFPSHTGNALVALQEVLRTGESVRDIRVVGEFGGKRRVLMINATPVTHEFESQRAAVLVARDVTRLVSLEQELDGRSHYHDLVGNSAKMLEIFQLVQNLAETDTTALLCGETGTGKELVAEALHRSGPRANGPLIKVNCGALSEDMLESELFGHVRGAFTGAIKDRKGRFEAANGGTIFLDEIGDISPRVQLRLLRVLQEHEFERVGESHPIRTDVRVIAATNQDLKKKIEAGEFRQDLYYRLNVVRIEIPPLRERREELPLLVDHFCRRFNEKFKKEVTGLSGEAMELMMRYSWPGNVRELENFLERAFIVCREPEIQARHLPPEIMGESVRHARPAALEEAVGMQNGLDKYRILEVLVQTDWNVAKSARRLGVARNTLYQKMKLYKLSRPEHA